LVTSLNLEDDTLAVPAAKVEFVQGAANTSDFGAAYAGPPSKILLMLVHRLYFPMAAKKL
jgi:hypothetical protein